MARSLAGCNPSRGRGPDYLGPSSRPGGRRDDRDLRIKPDIISLDELMPGRTGLEALQLLQQDERTKKIPVMAFGNVGDSSAIACVKHGAVDYHLLSEVTTDELVDAYSEYLNDPENYSPRVVSII